MEVKNSKEEIQKRIDSGLILRTPAMLAVFVRPALFLAFQGVMVLLLTLLKDKNPALTATSWWTVYGTLIDICCLLILFFLLRREKIRILDLFSFDHSKIGKDLLIGLGIIFLVFPLTIFIGSVIGSYSVYGTLHPAFPPGIPLNRTLPLWAALYSKIIWWAINAPSEELINIGYALPRLQHFFGRTWAAVLMISFGWSLQHSFLPYIDLKYAIFAFLLFFPLTITIQMIYLRTRRLLPVVIGHMGMDCLSAVFMITVI